MDKGARVTITKGKAAGKAGTVFWKGPNKFGAGERLGVRGDDGETYWVQDTDVEATSAAAPPMDAGPRFEKGDRVSFEVGGRDGTGTVFWIGESRQGPGQRLGVRVDGATEGDDAVWLDARQARPASGAPTPSPSRPPPTGAGADEGDDVPPEYASAGELPPAPPLSDDEIAHWAGAVEDED